MPAVQREENGGAPHIAPAKLSKTSNSVRNGSTNRDVFWVETSARRDIHRPNGDRRKRPLVVHPTLTSSIVTRIRSTNQTPATRIDVHFAKICESSCDFFLVDSPNHQHAWCSHPQKVLGFTRHVGHDVFGHWITRNHCSLEIKSRKLWMLVWMAKKLVLFLFESLNIKQLVYWKTRQNTHSVFDLLYCKYHLDHK